ncbi:hypothetical protein GCM10029978_116270 [Actinoallomurus acanthiterrae]
MAVDNSVDPAGWFAEQIGACEPDLLRKMVKTMAEALMSAEADAFCGAEYGQRSGERVNRRNGYRKRGWDTRAGTVAVALSPGGLTPRPAGTLGRRIRANGQPGDHRRGRGGRDADTSAGVLTRSGGECCCASG